MSQPCPYCLPLDCDSLEDQNLYSIERELFPFILSCPPGFSCDSGSSFQMVCCGQLLSAQFPPNATVDDKNTIRQEIVNQCGVRMAFCGNGDLPQNPPDDPVTLFLNSPKQCTVRCPDGNPFTYIIAAGTFAAPTQAQADQQAADAACVQAGLRKVCLGKLSGCLCVGAAYSATISHTGGLPPLHWSISSGALPTGLSIDQTGTISGTPTVNGTFDFIVQARQSDGSYMRKPYTLVVIEIVTSALTPFTVGTPYSFQIVASGGSGNYDFTITSGSLPDGLTMSLTGLISGTPTVGATSGFTVKVIDTSCEAVTKEFFPPSIRLVTASQTKIATVIGFNEYLPSFPPKRYHTLTWTGHSEQQLWWYPPWNGAVAVQIGGARFEYSGASNIDTYGVYTSHYQKQLTAMCNAVTNQVTSLVISPFGGLDGYLFVGWLGPTGHEKCALPGIPFAAFGDQAIGEGQVARMDSSSFWGSRKARAGISNVQVSNFRIVSSTQGVCVDVNTDLSVSSLIALFEPVPRGTVQTINGSNEGTTWFPAPVLWDHDYSATLTNEYTDAEALTNARTVNGNGSTAQNFPRTTGYVSSFTTVAFQLQTSGLVVGSDYLVSYDLWDQTAGIVSTVQIGFTAAAATHAINGTVPTPAAGHSITIRNPRIAFSS